MTPPKQIKNLKLAIYWASLALIALCITLFVLISLPTHTYEEEPELYITDKPAPLHVCHGDWELTDTERDHLLGGE